MMKHLIRFRKLEYKQTNKQTNSGILSTVKSHSEAHAGFFRLLMNGIFDPYVL